MKAFLFSDLHVSYKALDNLLKYDFKKEGIDLIIFAGDVVNMGEPVPFMEQFIKVIKNINLPFFWVPGNNDFGRSYYKLKAAFPSLESRITKFKSIKLAGVGGSPASWAGQYAGEKLVDKKLIGGSIFVSHVPPPGLLNYQKFDFESRTSKKLSDSPLVHICGHIHHQWGVAYLGTTKVVKLAAFELGYYGIIDLKTLAVEFKRINPTATYEVAEDGQN